MTRLGRRPPTDWKHLAKYPLRATAMPGVPVPVIVGTNWYRFMSNPEYDPSDRRYWIGRNVTNWGPVLGGHCYVLKPESIRDGDPWWDFYDQGEEGACVGFGCARAMSLVDRKRFDAWRIYREAQRVDEWPGEDYEGTSVRAGVDILRRDGAAPVRGGRIGLPDLRYGIAVNRWATTTREVYWCLQSPRLEAQGVVAFLNSWGRYYPHVTYMPAEVLDRLIAENGEATVFTPS